MKICNVCLTRKALAEFPAYKGRVRNYCRRCDADKQAARRQRLLARESVTVPEKKSCSHCSAVKAADEFSPSKQSQDGLYGHCKQCHSLAESLRHTSRTSEARLEKRLRTRYGKTLDWFWQLFADLDGCCPICSREFFEETSAPVVDHDHTCCPSDRTCGSCVRGLLCSSCNAGIGLLMDSPAVLAAGVAYLTASAG